MKLYFVLYSGFLRSCSEYVTTSQFFSNHFILFDCLLDMLGKLGSISLANHSSPESGSPPILILSDPPALLSLSLIMIINSSSDDTKSVSLSSSDAAVSVAKVKSSVSVLELYPGSP